MFRSLVRGLAESGRIRTSESKAKALQQEMDKLFQLVRKNTLASRKDMLSHLGNDSKTVDKLIGQYLPLANSRRSGFTSVTREGERRGDNTRMALIELIKVETEKSAPSGTIKEESEKLTKNE